MREKREKIDKLLYKREQDMKGDLRALINVTDSKVIVNKLSMIVRLRLVNGPLYIVTLIQIINKTKKIFVNDLMLNKEVRIPDKLTITFLEFK